jgi:hypothetical protein
LAQQTKQLEGTFQALMITLGEKLIPPLQRVTTWMLNNRDSMLEVAKGVGILMLALTGFAVVSKVMLAVKSLTTAFDAAATAVAAYRLRVLEAQAASLAAGGSVNGLAAAFSALSTKAKIALTATAIGLLVIAVAELSSLSEKAPPDIDRMTKSLTDLGHSGKVAGELAKTLGENLSKLGNAAELVAHKQSGMESFFESAYKVLTLGTDKSRTGKAIEQIEAIDQGLANMVSAGHADLAAAALKRLQDALAAQGGDPKKLAEEMHKYGDALAAAAMTEDLAADSMGALGKQAMETSKALDAQAMTAKGLKEAISDLNDVNRSALDSMAGFEAAIDEAAKAATENGRALRIVHGDMDLTTEKARAEEAALTDLASKTDAAAVAALDSGASLAEVGKIYDRGREQLMKLAQQMGLTRDQARELTNQILSTPDKTAYLRGDLSDLKAKLAETEEALRNARGEKRVKLLAEKDEIMADLKRVQAQIDDLHGKTVTIIYNEKRGNARLNGADAHGGIIGGAASGGLQGGGLTWVGENGPELVRLPPGAMVHSNPDSQRMASGASGGGQGGGVVQLEWVGGNAGDELLTWLRKNIRVRGGNVQSVLGN